MNSTYVAAIFGGLLKIYDDMEDNPLLLPYKTPDIMEIIKALIISSFTYVSIHDMNFPIIIFIGELLHVILSNKDANSTHFYYAGMIVAFLLCIITFDASMLHISTLILIMGSIIVGGVDHHFFPEEYSWKKIVMRFFLIITVIISLQFRIDGMNDNIEYLYFCYFVISYFIISICIMLFSLMSNRIPQESESLQKDTTKIIIHTISSMPKKGKNTRVDQKEGVGAPGTSDYIIAGKK